jgi:hypothetical protein
MHKSCQEKPKLDDYNNNIMISPAPRGGAVNLRLRHFATIELFLNEIEYHKITAFKAKNGLTGSNSNCGKLFIQQMFLLFFLLQAGEEAD